MKEKNIKQLLKLSSSITNILVILFRLINISIIYQKIINDRLY